MKILYIIWMFVLATLNPLLAQEDIISHKVSYELSSDKYSGETVSNAKIVSKTRNLSHRVAYQTVVSHPGSPFIRLYFGDINLGQHSYLKIISTKDGIEQRLDATSIQDWNYSTGYFNGGAVRIQLYVYENDSNIYFTLKELMIGEEKGTFLKKGSSVKARTTSDPEIVGSLCGADNRVATTDRAVGRLTNGNQSNCTVYITANGTVLTAGHCRDLISNGYDIVEFDIPASNNNGTVNHPSMNSQYPINTGSVQFEHIRGNLGNDWCVFRCNANSNTGLTPGWGQETFFRLARDFSPTTLRITGCGTDGGRDNQSLQTHTGLLDGETVDNANDAYFRYRVDTEPGNSGSPIIWNGTRTALGIHTNGGCNTDGNKGTSFEADDLENAINRNISNNAVHVDINHRSTNQNGVITRPYKSVSTAVANATSGALVSIAEGAYRERVVLRNVHVQAPVGRVAIGPSANARTASDNKLDLIATSEDDVRTEILTRTNVQIFPNPFVSEITVSYIMETSAVVDFAVYDLTGRQVEQFIQQEPQKAGNYEIKFDTNKFPTGIYLYQLRINEQETRGKIIKR